MGSSKRVLFGATAVAILFLSGCISLEPTPNYARTGDSININLGGVKRNVGGQGVSAADFAVTITDSASVVHTAEVTGVFRAFPDHTSVYAVSAQDRNDPNFGPLYPHDGAVWVRIRLTQDANTVLPLAPGPASVAVVSSKLTQTGLAFEANYGNFPIEIIPGTGDPTFLDQQFLAYSSYNYLTVKPDTALPAGVIGGMQVEIDFDASALPTAPFDPRLVPLNHDPNLNLIQNVRDNGDGTKTLIASLTNPNGFSSLATWSQGMSTELDLQLALVSHAGSVGDIADQNLSTVFTVTANSFYIDLNGDVIGGVTPELSNEFL